MALLLPVVSSCADSASSDLFTLSLHCALPICGPGLVGRWFIGPRFIGAGVASGTGDGRPPRRRDGSAPAGCTALGAVATAGRAPGAHRRRAADQRPSSRCGRPRTSRHPGGGGADGAGRHDHHCREPPEAVGRCRTLRPWRAELFPRRSGLRSWRTRSDRNARASRAVGWHPGSRARRRRLAGTGRGPAARGEDPAMSEPPTPPGRVRILLADDEPLVRQGMRLILDAEDDLEVIGEAGDGAEALALARRDAPDLVCMDVRMPDIDGIRATELVLRLPEPPKVLVVTTFEHDGYVLDALLAGASGFLLKRSGAQEMVQAVRTIAHGDSLLFPDAVRTLLRPRARSKGYTGPALKIGRASCRARGQ